MSDRLTPKEIARDELGMWPHEWHDFEDALRAHGWIIVLQDRGGDRARMGCPECTLTQQMDPNPPVMRCIVCGTGYWDDDR